MAGERVELLSGRVGTFIVGAHDANGLAGDLESLMGVVVDLVSEKLRRAFILLWRIAFPARFLVASSARTILRVIESLQTNLFKVLGPFLLLLAIYLASHFVFELWYLRYLDPPSFPVILLRTGVEIFLAVSVFRAFKHCVQISPGVAPHAPPEYVAAIDTAKAQRAFAPESDPRRDSGHDRDSHVRSGLQTTMETTMENTRESNMESRMECGPVWSASRRLWLWPKSMTDRKAVFDDLTVCLRCKPPRVKVSRAHHCGTCGVCVLRMDHHCPWVNNCIGERNLSYFVVLLSWLVAAALYTSLSLSIPFYRAVYKEEWYTRYDFTDTEKYFLTLGFAFSLVILLAVSILFGIHLYLLSQDLTTLELQLFEREPSPLRTSLYSHLRRTGLLSVPNCLLTQIDPIAASLLLSSRNADADYSPTAVVGEAELAKDYGTSFDPREEHVYRGDVMAELTDPAEADAVAVV